MTQIDPRHAAEVIGAIIKAWGAPIVPDERPATPDTDTPDTDHVHAPTTATGSTGGQATKPVEGPITSRFGDPRPGRIHQGVDIAVPTGTTVVAAHSGRVTHAASDDPGGYGTWVEITADDGTSSRYGHLSAVSVRVGQMVEAGTPIGVSGATGNAKGPHLHFEIRKGGKAVDPVPYLAGAGPITSTTVTPGESVAADEDVQPPSPESVVATKAGAVESALRGEQLPIQPSRYTGRPPI